MSADLDYTKGRPAIAYVGKTPWHAAGQRLEPGETIEKWRTAAGLDFRYVEKEARYHWEGPGGEELRAADQYKLICRDDTGEAIACVGADYNLVQPDDVLEFYRELVDASGQWDLETAGVLRGGRKIWALARARYEDDIDGDVIRPYLLLATSCDGSMSTIGKFTGVRVVCNNTLTAAEMAVDKGELRITHAREFNIEATKKALGLMDGTFAEYMTGAREMAEAKLAATPEAQQAVAFDYFSRLYAPEPVDNLTDMLPPMADWSTARRKRVNELMNAFYNAPGAQGKTAWGTVWGALNAVTYHEDHRELGRGTAEGRAHSTTFGSASRTKARAVALARELMADGSERDIYVPEDGMVAPTDGDFSALLNKPARIAAE